MTKKIKLVGTKASTIHSTSALSETLNPEDIAHALGGELVYAMSSAGKSPLGRLQAGTMQKKLPSSKKKSLDKKRK